MAVDDLELRSELHCAYAGGGDGKAGRAAYNREVRCDDAGIGCPSELERGQRRSSSSSSSGSSQEQASPRHPETMERTSDAPSVGQTVSRFTRCYCRVTACAAFRFEATSSVHHDSSKQRLSPPCRHLEHLESFD